MIVLTSILFIIYHVFNVNTFTMFYSSLFVVLMYQSYLHHLSQSAINELDKTEFEVYDNIKVYLHTFDSYAFSYKYKNFIIISVHEMFKNDREILNSIIGHELGHIKQNHLIIKLFYDVIFFMFILFISRNYIDFIVLLVLVYLLQQYFSRVFEYLADSYSVKIFGKTSFIRLLNRLGKYTADKPFYRYLVSSHPSIENRINKFK